MGPHGPPDLFRSIKFGVGGKTGKIGDLRILGCFLIVRCDFVNFLVIWLLQLAQGPCPLLNGILGPIQNKIAQEN